MIDQANFEPKWLSKPGDTISARLKTVGTTRSDFAWQIGFSEEQLSDLMAGRAEITAGVAKSLSTVLGGSIEFWQHRDAAYRKDAKRLAELIPVGVRKTWLRSLPINDMANFGWIQPSNDPIDKMAACMRFFNVATFECWEQQIKSNVGQTNFRNSETFKSNPASVMAWLRIGEIQAQEIECASWNKDAFKQCLTEARSLTRLRDPAVFLPKLRALFAAAGVALVVARTPSRCHASGATKFLSRDKALILMSFRYLSDDHFWFTLFHEAAHLILHDNDKTYLEGDALCAEEVEKEANEFSQNLLIPQQFRSELAQTAITEKRILRLATRIGIAPGIVVGQLQHMGRVQHNYFNYLKRRFKWA
jgi:HTH-type transcriptional regulator / antitoxin HigA